MTQARRERWRRTRELFEQALGQAADERPSWLASRCASDAELLREVRALLAADAAERSPAACLLSGPPPLLEVWPTQPGSSVLPMGPGQRFGPFTVLSVLGHGGMGVVYLAEQEQPRRKVALKTLQHGIGSAEAMRRFVHEGEVLGQLRHPHIAQVFACGTVQLVAGPAATPPLAVPYFAMELVEGARSLDAWLREEPRPLQERLSLFRSVCDAVRHGHRQGFLHRDLKPANILVDAAGRPKVIDFGIARALADRQQDVIAAMTTAGQWLGTPAYMSPEQLDRQDLDVRCDVYALGLVLFELLSGVQAIAVAGLAPDAVFERVRRGIVSRPTAVAGPSMLPPGCRELDWIVARATATERDRRYGSVDELVADVDRYLQRQPVLAGPTSTWYRWRKIAERHRVAVATATIVLLALLTGATAAAIGLQRAVAAEGIAIERQRRAEREADRAARINRFLVGMLQSVHPERGGRDVRVVDLLQQAADELDTAAAMGMDPLEEGTLRATLAHSLLALDQMTLAAPQIERAAELAIALLVEDDAQRWTILQNLGVLRLRQDRLPEAEQLLVAALAARTALFGEHHLDVASSRQNMATLLERQGDLTGAIEQSTRAATTFAALLGPSHRDTLRAQLTLATLLAAVGRRAEAVDLVAHVDAEARARLGPRHPVTLSAAATRAVLLHDRGDLAGAAACLREVLDAREQVLGPRHQSTLAAGINLATICIEIGEQQEAERLLRTTVTVLQQDDKMDGRLGLQARHNLAAVLQRLDRLDEALALHDEVAAAAAARLPAVHWQHGAFAKERGVTLGRLGRRDEAIAELTRAVRILTVNFGAADPRVMRAAGALAELESDACSDQVHRAVDTAIHARE